MNESMAQWFYILGIGWLSGCFCVLFLRPTRFIEKKMILIELKKIIFMDWIGMILWYWFISNDRIVFVTWEGSMGGASNLLILLVYKDWIGYCFNEYNSTLVHWTFFSFWGWYIRDDGQCLPWLTQNGSIYLKVDCI